MLEGVGTGSIPYHYTPPPQSERPPATSTSPAAPSSPSPPFIGPVSTSTPSGNWADIHTLAETQIATIEADSVVASIQGDSPTQKLDSLRAALKGQSQQVISQTLQNPAVKQLGQAEAKWIAQPYSAPSANTFNVLDPAQPSEPATSEASTRLADAVKGMPPAVAAQILQDSLPTIKKIASLNPNAGLLGIPGPTTSFSKIFTNVSRAVDALGNNPKYQGLINQIAQAYVGQFTTPTAIGSPNTPFDTPSTGAIPYALAHGASPTLALALANQLAGAGQTGAAYAIVKTALQNPISRLQTLQTTIDQDVSQYTSLTKDLNWAISSTQGMLTPAQMTTAINKYMATHSSLNTKLSQLSKQMTADVSALDAIIAELKKLPPGLQGFAGGALNSVGQDASTQKAVAFVAANNPQIFAGGDDSSGSEALAFWGDQGARNHELTSALTGAYLVDTVMPAFKQLAASHDSPAAIARVKAVLADLKAGHPGSRAYLRAMSVRALTSLMRSSPKRRRGNPAQTLPKTSRSRSKSSKGFPSPPAWVGARFAFWAQLSP
jgi:hypothetical protein